MLFYNQPLNFFTYTVLVDLNHIFCIFGLFWYTSSLQNFAFGTGRKHLEYFIDNLVHNKARKTSTYRYIFNACRKVWKEGIWTAHL